MQKGFDGLDYSTIMGFSGKKSLKKVQQYNKKSLEKV